MDVGGFHEVEAEILFDLAPHLASVATFAVHLTPYYWRDQWTVCNIETGLSIAKGKSEKQAIEDARKILQTKTEESMSSGYLKAIKKYEPICGKL